jgi:hypothetical protein
MGRRRSFHTGPPEAATGRFSPTAVFRSRPTERHPSERSGLPGEQEGEHCHLSRMICGHMAIRLSAPARFTARVVRGHYTPAALRTFRVNTRFTRIESK